MDKQSTSNNLDNLRRQIELLSQRLDNIDKTLNIQEEMLDLLTEHTKSLFKEVFSDHKSSHSIQEIMKSAFPNKTIPKILFS